MMKYLPGLLLLTLLVLSTCKNDNEGETLDAQLIEAISSVSKTNDLSYYTFPASDDYVSLPNQDPANPVTEEKVKLGQLLFFETALAQIPTQAECYETYSCATCHIPTAGFMPGRKQGIADGAIGFGSNGESRLILPAYRHDEVDAQGTRPMNPMNSVFSTNTLWSGAFGAGGVNEGTEELWTGLAEVNHTGYMGLEAQNIEAFELHRLEINDHVLDDYGYRALYDAAFPDFQPSERYSPTTSSFAISAFLRSLLSNRAPFQDWLKGNELAITEDQKKGALLFFGKAKCYNCHKEPALNAMAFHALGTADMYQVGGANTGPQDVRNLGRGMFTGKEIDNYRFKVPQLYNLKEYVTFFHGSSKTSLREVIDYKLLAHSENPAVPNRKLSGLFQPVELSEKEIDQLIDFLENALYDAEMDRYVPESVLSGNCFPNNDSFSKEDLGCD